MSMSGIGISDDLKNTLTDFKLNKLDGTEYLLVKLSEDKKQVVVGKKGPKRPDDDTEEQAKDRFSDLIGSLKGDEPCYIFYDFHFKKGDRPQEKIALIFWCLDSEAPRGLKMTYASTNKAVSDAGNVNNFKFDFRDRDSYNYDSIILELQQKIH